MQLPTYRRSSGGEKIAGLFMTLFISWATPFALIGKPPPVPAPLDKLVGTAQAAEIYPKECETRKVAIQSGITGGQLCGWKYAKLEGLPSPDFATGDEEHSGVEGKSLFRATKSGRKPITRCVVVLRGGRKLWGDVIKRGRVCRRLVPQRYSQDGKIRWFKAYVD